jgi:hypothetical protein
VAGFCEYGDEPSGSGATELVTILFCHKVVTHPDKYEATLENCYRCTISEKIF